jgi:plastocyanin
MLRPLAVIALSATMRGGCGGDGDEGNGRTITSSAGPGRNVTIVGDEYSFDPKGIVLTGASESAPTTLRLTLQNRGSLAHNARVERDGRDLGGTPIFQGGEVRSGEVELSPGKYRLVCTVGDHEQLGMVGALEVRASGG